MPAKVIGVAAVLSLALASPQPALGDPPVDRPVGLGSPEHVESVVGTHSQYTVHFFATNMRVGPKFVPIGSYRTTRGGCAPYQTKGITVAYQNSATWHIRTVWGQSQESKNQPETQIADLFVVCAQTIAQGALNESIKVLTDKVSDLAKELQKLPLIEALDKSLKESQAEVAGLKTDVDKLEKELADARRRIQSLDQRLQVLERDRPQQRVSPGR